jgi:hypothetical protein
MTHKLQWKGVLFEISDEEIDRVSKLLYAPDMELQCLGMRAFYEICKCWADDTHLWDEYSYKYYFERDWNRTIARLHVIKNYVDGKVMLIKNF